MEKLVWHKINCSGEIPGPRYGHSAQILGSRMFLFGGKGPNSIVYKDVFFLDLIEWVWVPVKAISASPLARYCNINFLLLLSYHKENFCPDFFMLLRLWVERL